MAKPELLAYLSEPANDKRYKPVVVRFKLDEFYRNPPVQGGGVVIGSSFDSIKSDLEERYGDRLASISPGFLH